MKFLIVTLVFMASSMASAAQVLVCLPAEDTHMHVAVSLERRATGISGMALDNYNSAKLTCHPTYRPGQLLCVGQWFRNENIELSLTREDAQSPWQARLKRPRSSGGQVVNLPCQIKTVK